MEQEKPERKPYEIVVRPRRIKVARVYQESDLEPLYGHVVELEKVGLAVYGFDWFGRWNPELGRIDKSLESRVHTFVMRDIYRGLMEDSIVSTGVDASKGKISFTPEGLIKTGTAKEGWLALSLSEKDDPKVYCTLKRMLEGEGLWDL